MIKQLIANVIARIKQNRTDQKLMDEVRKTTVHSNYTLAELSALPHSTYSGSDPTKMRSGWAEMSQAEPLGAMATRVLGSDTAPIIKPPRG